MAVSAFFHNRVIQFICFQTSSRPACRAIGWVTDSVTQPTALRQFSPFLSTDRALEQELRICLELIRKQHWDLFEKPGLVID
jgi:hypothetical protein